ncbi:MAG: DUF177 domain-containing protein [Deltaproteobacteria bacterium]|nr:DUF177 domain-containing protein [Deltaproteobacteria bacterium]
MEIIIRDIPEEGQDLHFDSQSEGWFRELMTDAFLDLYKKGDKASVNLHLLRTGPNVDCRGVLQSDYHPTCCRCLEVFEARLDIPFHLTLAPLYESDRQLKTESEDEDDLVMEDLEFAYYEGDRFNLGNVLREQIILAIPMQPLCFDACRGLCQRCGVDLNKNPCDCKREEEDPRWETLKAFKTKI